MKNWQSRKVAETFDNPRYRGLRGTETGAHGPVKVIVKNGTPVLDDADRITREQELAEQDYTQGCPFDRQIADEG